MARGKKSGSCPRHGRKYLVKDGASYYCGAPTPGEMSSKCFYHPNSSHPSETKIILKKIRIEERYKPNLWKVMLNEWERNKKNRIAGLQKQRAKAAEKKLLAYN